MERKDFSEIASGFGIVNDFARTAVEIGESFLTDMPELEEITSEEEEEDETPKAKPTPSLPKPTALEIGEEFLEEINEDEEDEESEDKTIVTPKSKAKEEKAPIEAKQEDEEDGDVNPFEAIASQLFESGLFSLDEDEELPEITSGEDLLERFTYEKNKQAHNTIYNFLSSKHGEEGVELFDAIFQKGAPIREYLQTYADTEDLASLDLEGVDNAPNQRKILTMAYQSQGWDPEDIKAELNKLEQYGDLEVTAKRHHRGVVNKKQEELKQIELQAEKKEREELQRTQYYNNAMNQILSQKLKDKTLDGIPVTDKVAREAYQALTQPAFKMPDGSIGTAFDAFIYNLNRPENYEKKVKFWLLAQLEQKDPSFETIKKKGVSEKTDKLFNKLVTQEKKAKHTNPISAPSRGFTDGY